MDRNWAYEVNIFLNVTEHNYELAFKISEFHYNALLAAAATDSFFKTMADDYKPFHDAMETTYTAWKNSGGTQKGETLTAYQLLALSAARLNGWEPAITGVYLKGTPVI